MEFSYPARFHKCPDGRLLVTFPDLQGAATDGADEREASAEAIDCLAEALAMRIAGKLPIPPASKPKRGHRLVPVPTSLAPKVALYLAIGETGISNVQLAKRLGVTENVIRRMLDPKHATRTARIEAALAALGRRLVVSVQAA